LSFLFFGFLPVKSNQNDQKNVYFCGMKLFLLTFGLLALSIAGIAIKILTKKQGEFSGTCASQSPFLNKEGKPCSLCGKKPDEQNCVPNPSHN
tara:strand:+ start:118 stop:396 length:279 start_codon:yes stop_codon:yes gene_type:complete